MWMEPIMISLTAVRGTDRSGEHSESRKVYRNWHYSRKLTITSGDVKLSVPKLKCVPFETAIIERYRRCESSVEEESTD